MNSWYTMSAEDVQAQLGTTSEKGLSEAQVEELRATHGSNKLKEKPKKTLAQRFFEQLKDFMVIVLIIAAFVSAVVSLNSGESLVEPLIIVAIVILNAVLGVVQESKAEAALEALQKMSSPHSKVMRNGEVKIIESHEIVPGDIIILEAGDSIPADGRIIECASLKCDESALTGESVPVEKDANAVIAATAPLGDRINMVYSGCSVSYGRAVIVATTTGMSTEMGKIASLLANEEDGETPLQKKLNQLGKYLGLLALGICAIIFVIGLISKMPPLEIFMTAVSLAVAAIPEGLTAVVTIVLAMGVQRMVKRRAIIRKLPAVETLGSASVICSDKTGTLTQNRMTLVKAWAAGDAQVTSLDEEVGSAVRRLIKLSALCCDGKVEKGENGELVSVGDPTETAIVAAQLNIDVPKSELDATCPRVAEIPFDSDRKLMTTVHNIGGKIISITKGAPDILISRCSEIDSETASTINGEMGRDALRVLAVGCKQLDAVPENPTSEELENGLSFVGLVGMIDPPRQEAKDAIKVCGEAGIRTVMITGDHIVTACAIARDLGILREGDEAISGTELAAMSDEELYKNIRKYSVYARVTPNDKIRIVKAWQAAGEVVSMTGDGVNDAPALKAADIGCAMGITGTDVAKGAADVTLTDDNFATIVEAVKEGRGIFDNIKKAVRFLLSCNFGEIITVFLSMLIYQEAPLAAMHLLLVNLVTDSLPALALGVEPAEPDLMHRRPRSKDESILTKPDIVTTILGGVMIGLLTLAAFIIGYNSGEGANLEVGRTMAFGVLALSQLMSVLTIRTGHTIFSKDFFNNNTMLLAEAASIIITLAVMLIPGLSTHVFEFVQLDGIMWLWIVLLSLVPIVVTEIIKLVKLIMRKLNPSA